MGMGFRGWRMLLVYEWISLLDADFLEWVRCN